MFLFGLTIFVSAFLLFLVQPMIAKTILPWFGGSAAVWTTCMMFFQTALLLGYTYAFGSVRRWKPRTQATVHLCLLALSLLALPIWPNPAWKPSGSEEPVLRMLALLAVTVGVPYFVLSTTGPLLQAWYVNLHATRMPYRFYALSNAGSLLALLSYPVAVEPLLRLSRQAYGWSAVYAAFVLMCGAVTVKVWLAGRQPAPVVPSPDDFEAVTAMARPTTREQILWIALAACPSALLLSITNHLSQNIAPIPLLWVVPLSVYLLSLILCFDSDRWYVRHIWIPLFLLSVGGMAFELLPRLMNDKIGIVIPLFVAGLFFCSMACHGELARRKPPARYLTTFYLMLSLGGAVGGIFVAVVAPLIFNAYLELPLALLASVVLVTALILRDGYLTHKTWVGAAEWVTAVAASLGLVYLLTVGHIRWIREQKLVERNFYGQLRVADRTDPTNGLMRALYHGTICHGEEILRPGKEREPISYYGPRSGLALAIKDRQHDGAIRMGVIGLGTGTAAGWARSVDFVRFYEINPMVPRIATSNFAYLPGCPCKTDIVLGDARRELELEPPQNFDVLAVDAFSSDAIPVHLLTVEAFREYFRHLKPNGILAVHISNRYLDLEWVVRLGAEALGKKVVGIFDDDDDKEPYSDSDWMLVSGAPNAFEGPAWNTVGIAEPKPRRLRLWTDEYSNLLAILQ